MFVESMLKKKGNKFLVIINKIIMLGEILSGPLRLLDLWHVKSLANILLHLFLSK